MPSMDRNANDATRLRRNAQRQRTGAGAKDIKAVAPISTATGSIALTTDGSTLAVVGGALGVKAGGVGTSQLANGGVTLAKLGALTTKGDILTYDTGHNRLPVGVTGQVLTADSTATPGVKWADSRRDFFKRLRQAVNLNYDEATAAAPPTIQAATSSGVAVGSYYPALVSTTFQTYFRYEKANMVINANPNFVGRGNITSVNTTSAFEVSFMFDGLDVEMQYKAANPHVQYLVNDQLAGSPQLTWGTGSNWFQRLTFASRATRKITVRGANDFWFAYARGASVTDTIWYPPTPNKMRAVIIGDSFTEPTIPDTTPLGYNGWADWLGRLMGWDAWPSGSGGTGWTTNGGITGRFTFGNRFTDVSSYTPDILVVAGGLNDRNNYSSGGGCSPCGAAAFQSALAAYAVQIATVSSIKLVVIVGPWRTNGNRNTDTVLNSIATDLQAMVTTNNGINGVTWIYVDNAAWINGSGNVGATVGNGNQDYYLGTDGVHPSNLGHYYRGYRVATEIIRQL